MAYLRKKRDLPSMMLCGNHLPWVESVKHLGITVTNEIDGCQKDMMQKRARYIERSCKILQEFNFAHSDSKMKLQTVYNSHFTGSPCWDLTSRAGEMFEATFNRSIKLTYGLPLPTHRSLIPVISKVKPLRITLSSRLLTFVSRLRKSEKPVLRKMLSIVENDVRTVTGRNLRNTLLLTKKSSIMKLSAHMVLILQLNFTVEFYSKIYQ